ncbi:MAG: hypothetical protein AABW54_03120 [Candidatus Micrarchaeota archaeon]
MANSQIRTQKRVATAKELRERLSQTNVVGVEPVHGCGFQCSKCMFAPMPEERSLMDVNRFERALIELKHSGIVKANTVMHELASPGLIFAYSLGGNPPEHPRLHEITNVIKRHFPEAKVHAFWNLGGVNTPQALVKRTQNLDALCLSLDAQHYAGLRKELMPRIKELPAAERKQAVNNELVRRIGWVARAATENCFTLAYRLTGKETEAKVFREIIRAAEAKHGSGILYGEDEPTPRLARGSMRGRKSTQPLILHDCTITDHYPE